MKILLTNDDGIAAQGITTLENILLSLNHQVFVVAPASERSMCGHRVTTYDPITLTQRDLTHWEISGTPADCVRIGLFHLQLQPDWICSGINHGGNLGQDTYISGTVAAAREACYHHIPSISLSHYLKKDLLIDWQSIQRWANPLLQYCFDNPPLPSEFYNINFPHLDTSLYPPNYIPPHAWTLPELAPLNVNYKSQSLSPTHFSLNYQATYSARPKHPDSDVTLCFNDQISCSRIHL
jgi:5'-nucleotidase